MEEGTTGTVLRLRGPSALLLLCRFVLSQCASATPWSPPLRQRIFEIALGHDEILDEPALAAVLQKPRKCSFQDFCALSSRTNDTAFGPLRDLDQDIYVQGSPLEKCMTEGDGNFVRAHTAALTMPGHPLKLWLWLLRLSLWMYELHSIAFTRERPCGTDLRLIGMKRPQIGALEPCSPPRNARPLNWPRHNFELMRPLRSRSPATTTQAHQ